VKVEGKVMISELEKKELKEVKKLKKGEIQVLESKLEKQAGKRSLEEKTAEGE
jgi:hypothetical protein